jgi:hypothetical protein
MAFQFRDLTMRLRLAADPSEGDETLISDNPTDTCGCCNHPSGFVELTDGCDSQEEGCNQPEERQSAELAALRSQMLGLTTAAP